MATFWFLPILIISFAVILAISLVSFDHQFTFNQDRITRLFIVNSAESARSILTTISGAMIGVAGTVFSVTLVALTLASSQFGPRLIKNFMYVRLNQVVLGSYVSTFLYCLLVLNSIRDTEGYTFIPSYSIIVAILATVVNIILLIVFIHQIAVSIQADQVIADISAFISKQVKTLFPEKMGQNPPSDTSVNLGPILSQYPYHQSITAPKSGYLQYVDSEALIEKISESDSLLKLHFRPGRYLIEQSEIATIYSKTEFPKDINKEICKNIVIGKTKTVQQDLEFSIHQLVEIAVRALSPGVNDPYTALSCIDNLSATMAYLAEAQFPSKYRYDQENTLRIISDTFDFEGILDVAFHQIRQCANNTPSVIIRLLEALTDIQSFAHTSAQKNAIEKHVQMVIRVGEATIKEKHDLSDLQSRARAYYHQKLTS